MDINCFFNQPKKFNLSKMETKLSGNYYNPSTVDEKTCFTFVPVSIEKANNIYTGIDQGYILRMILTYNMNMILIGISMLMKRIAVKINAFALLIFS